MYIERGFRFACTVGSCGRNVRRTIPVHVDPCALVQLTPIAEGLEYMAVDLYIQYEDLWLGGWIIRFVFDVEFSRVTRVC